MRPGDLKSLQLNQKTNSVIQILRNYLPGLDSCIFPVQQRVVDLSTVQEIHRPASDRRYESFSPQILDELLETSPTDSSECDHLLGHPEGKKAFFKQDHNQKTSFYNTNHTKKNSYNTKVHTFLTFKISTITQNFDAKPSHT